VICNGSHGFYSFTDCARSRFPGFKIFATPATAFDLVDIVKKDVSSTHTVVWKLHCVSKAVHNAVVKSRCLRVVFENFLTRNWRSSHSTINSHCFAGMTVNSSCFLLSVYKPYVFSIAIVLGSLNGDQKDEKDVVETLRALWCLRLFLQGSHAVLKVLTELWNRFSRP